MTKFIITDRAGQIIALADSVAAAARTVLQYDGQRFNIRPMAAGGFQLWLSKPVANKPWTPSRLWSFELNEDLAIDEIFNAVLDAGFDGIDVCSVEQYRHEIAEAQRQSDPELAEHLAAALAAAEAAGL